MDKNNMVAVNATMRESIMKEEKAFRLREFFSLNPKVCTEPKLSFFCITLKMYLQAMDTLPPKPNLVVRGEMPEIVAKKVKSRIW